MKITIDRFEGDMAIVELQNGVIVECPKVLFPKEVAEGNIVEIRIDKKATKQKLDFITKKMNDLFKD